MAYYNDPRASFRYGQDGRVASPRRYADAPSVPIKQVPLPRAPGAYLPDHLPELWGEANRPRPANYTHQGRKHDYDAGYAAGQRKAYNANYTGSAGHRMDYDAGYAAGQRGAYNANYGQRYEAAYSPRRYASPARAYTSPSRRTYQAAYSPRRYGSSPRRYTSPRRY